MKKIWPVGLGLLLAFSMSACAESGTPGAGSSVPPPASYAADSSEANASAPDVSGASSQEQTPAEEAPVVGGIITASDADSLTLAAPDGSSYTFSIGDADQSAASGLDAGSAVWVYYSGELPTDGSAVQANRLVQMEPKSVTGAVNEGTAMSTLVLDTDHGQMEFSLGAANVSGANGLVIGKKLNVTYAENPDAPPPFQVVTLIVEEAK